MSLKEEIPITGQSLVSAVFSPEAFAQKAPRTVDELQRNSDSVIVGTVEDIQVNSQPSRIESGIGNTDWEITLTVSVEENETGDIHETRLDVRCIRVRTRGSVLGSISLTGHRPIPGLGTPARFYLEQDRDSWTALMPNGIVAVSENNPKQRSKLKDAIEVTELGNPRYAFILPSEAWTLVITGGVSGLFVRRILRSHRLVAK